MIVQHQKPWQIAINRIVSKKRLKAEERKNWIKKDEIK